jgi:SAM-dependent methyltransferase
MSDMDDAASQWDRLASIYDELTPVSERFLDTEGCVDFLAALASHGRALELGIGSGRVALPLARRGVSVDGIDLSPRMVARLRSKPGAECVRVSIGDFADVAVEGVFSLVYTVFTTFFNLTTQDDQLRCFRNVADRLSEGGAFVVEADVPDPEGFVAGRRLDVTHLDSSQVLLSAVIYQRASQIEESQLLVLSEKGLELFPIRVRYAWPSELDLMARLAGLELRERWSDWRRRPFDEDSRRHVSVYARPDGSTQGGATPR